MPPSKELYRTKALYLSLSIVFMLVFPACKNNQQASPKPRTYPKIEFPSKSYLVYTPDNCNFSFEYPEYAIIEAKSALESMQEDPSCWFDLVIPDFNGRLHCSYYEISPENELENLIFDSFSLVGKHNIKAQYIEEIPIELGVKGGGMLFRIKGPVASPTQFFVTDSTDNFLRGSLYFYNKVQVDSMRVIYDFVNKDIDHLLETFSWK